ncbi:MAG TPA: hypothetical protein VK835_08290 [Bacteroidia bacterium]|jgi:hypothetical protein|nr:hypothetical protein [Bacteroidia bacterium]
MKLIYALPFLLVTLFVNAQTTYLKVNPNIYLPKDSVESKKLTTALNDFLLAAQKPNEENKFVFEPEKIETFILLDEVNGIEKNWKLKDDFFYKPYLNNVVLLKDNTYLLQVAYMGTNEGVPLLRASFEFVAHKTGDSFMFSSTLIKNTKNWKTEKAGNNVFHYQNTINADKVKEFGKLTAAFDLKLKVNSKTTDYYCCDNIIELEKLVGVDYKMDYNSIAESVWSSSFGDRKLIVFGNNNASFNTFDLHDLFHDRLSLVIARSKVNKPVDEGCAYLYGGSWGLTWKEIFKAFKEQIASNKTIDWTAVKETPMYFKTNGFNNAADYIVNALLVEKIEKEKGFAAVWELLNVGSFEKGNEKYYQTLEKLTGITKANYNSKIWELITNEK